MNVYYNGNGDLWRRGRKSEKLTSCPIQKTFLWEKQEIFIPALYTGKSGVILDLCIKIPIDAMAAFFQKWDRDRRLSLNRQEDYEQMEADNPCCIDFETKLRLDGIPLTSRMWGSIVWYPQEIAQLEAQLKGDISPAAREYFPDEDKEENLLLEEWENDKDAEKLMKAYRCDKNFCWYFCRRVYSWKKEPILSWQKISLILKESPIPVTAAYFTTTLSCQEKNIQILDPETGQAYTLTLYECEETNVDFSGIAKNGIRYPCCCQTISFGISPKPDGCPPEIRDCANGDSPQKDAAASETFDSAMISESCGPTAFFVAKTSHSPERYAAVSSLYFKQPKEIRWRVIFQVNTRPDIEICFTPISTCNDTSLSSESQEIP